MSKKTRPAGEAGQADKNESDYLNYEDFMPNHLDMHPEILAIVFRNAARRAVIRDIEAEIYRETGNYEFASYCGTMLQIKFQRIGGCCA